MTPNSSQRRRVGAPSDPQPHYVAVTDPDHNQDLDQNQTDLISLLPDCLLSSILLLLPIRDAICTSLLSSRWRHVWKQNPLHFDDSSIKFDQSCRFTILQATACIASTHPGPIHSFRTCKFTIGHDLDALIETLTRKDIREFNLSFGYQGTLGRYNSLGRYQIPLSLLQCQSLCKLSLSDCFFRPSPVLDSSFPNLKELTLEFVFLWDDLLCCLFKSCTQLEVLQLINCTGLQHVHINSAKLQKLTFHQLCHLYVKRIEIENAPELRSLMLGEKTVHETRISVQNVPKLEVLGFISMDATMQIGRTFSMPYNRIEMCVNESMKLPDVKKLAILVSFDTEIMCSLLASVLRCLPCLETLVIKCIKPMGPGPQVGFWEQQNMFGCLENHLKYVCMINSVGLSAEREFVKFLVQHGRVLERMTAFSEDGLTTSLVKPKHRELRLNHASTDVKVELLTKSGIDSECSEWAPLLSPS